MVFAIESMRCMMILFFFLFLKDRSSLQYFITQGMDQSLCSLPYVLHICNFRGRTWGLGRVGGGRGGIPGLHACLL